MDKMEAQNHSRIIMESLQSYLTDFDKRYKDPDDTVTKAECDRANYVQGLINIVMGKQKHTTTGLPTRQHQEALNHKMISVSLECIMHYRKNVNDRGHKRFALGTASQQSRMYNERILKRQLDNTFWGLTKPFIASLPDEQIAEVKRLSGMYSPMEVVQIILAREDELTDDDVEADIIENARAMNGGLDDERLYNSNRQKKSFLRWFSHHMANDPKKRAKRRRKRIRRKRKKLNKLFRKLRKEEDQDA